MPATLPFRLTRAAAFAVVCAGLSVAAHVFAGGALSGSGVVVALALAFASALPLSGRERTLRVILPLLTLLQIVSHLMLTMTHGMAEGMAVGHMHAGLMPEVGMLVMHGWAIGLTGLWLARGEAVLWALLRRVGARLRVPVIEVVQPTSPWLPGPHAHEPRVLTSALLRYTAPQRGPPRSLTAASA
ncbi:hypothetical protein SAMN05421505_102111 [Sinosporangium album]|uniref:Uncharacterized protein n=1 Tax=Sinosporangium album TaxID=504805 RepID=A0A1G7RZL5_9ACTN|nr:hypothetical protein [Sinosporangium album]SDG16222.1 hypothetical protein SAMN05421505_102111 [Sinosporangium album]